MKKNNESKKDVSTAVKSPSKTKNFFTSINRSITSIIPGRTPQDKSSRKMSGEGKTSFVLRRASSIAKCKAQSVWIPCEEVKYHFEKLAPSTSTINTVFEENYERDRNVSMQLTEERVIGNGSFGTVVLYLTEHGDRVALKTVLQDQNYKHRELPISRKLSHPNVICLQFYFLSPTTKPKNGTNYNLAFEFMPQSAEQIIKTYRMQRERLPSIMVKALVFQLFRGMAYLHSLNICHRDSKPANLLCDIKRGILKICDFGSAKVLKREETNIAYICSRYYRAPELICGEQAYTSKVDVWSCGAIFAEMITLETLFVGFDSLDQLASIIRIMGSPTKDEMDSINMGKIKKDMPSITGPNWPKYITKSASSDCVDLLSAILNYDPSKRPSALKVLTHPYFDILKDPTSRINNHHEMPKLFNFSSLEMALEPSLRSFCE